MVEFERESNKYIELDDETEGWVRDLIRIYYHDTGQSLSIKGAIKSIISTVHGIMTDKVTHED